ncbi:MAG TPA: Gfo/Idh/MocA family oxidoreductase, partial [Candidatus Limnocylindrales bacterium]|nr:Gfo/Idh/MocA family oxidoreductase [Candidatus Limnocylindrales bacterium]
MTVQVALVGMGYWGPNLARALNEVDGGALHTICDADPGRLERARRRFPGARLATSFDEVIADPAIDAVVLAVPVSAHYALARRALEHRKHVFVEKPLARTAAECEDLIAIAAAGSLTLMVGHVFLYNAAVAKVKEYIDGGVLGEIRYVYSQRLNLGQVRQDVNALWNFAPHDFSILCHWLGAEPERVIARGYSYVQPGIEDVVFMTLDFPNGVGANVHISWLDPLKVRRMTVVGTEKMVVYDDVSSDARITLYDKGVSRKPAGNGGPRQSLGSYETFGEFQLLLRAGDVLIPTFAFPEPLGVEC